MVVDGGVQVHISRSLAAFGGAVPVGATAQRAPASAVGDPAELLHIQMDQMPRTGCSYRNGTTRIVSPQTSRSRSRETPRRTRIRPMVEAASSMPKSFSSATSIDAPSLHAPAQPFHQVFDLMVGLPG